MDGLNQCLIHNSTLIEFLKNEHYDSDAVHQDISTNDSNIFAILAGNNDRKMVKQYINGLKGIGIH